MQMQRRSPLEWLVNVPGKSKGLFFYFDADNSGLCHPGYFGPQCISCSDFRFQKITPS